MKKLAIAAAVSMALTSSAAQAADWTGWYAGAQLGYGDVDQGKIPANSILTFELELLEVKPAPPPKR